MTMGGVGMIRYIFRRSLAMILILLATAFIIFTITYLIPGDPATAMLGTSASAEDITRMQKILGVDQPYITQLIKYFYNTFIRFDFGESWVYKVPVFEEMGKRMPYTLILGLGGMILNMSVGIGLGVFAGTHEGKWQDTTTMGIAMVFASAPGFWVALLMIMLFSVNLGWLPAFGIGSFKHYIMPIISGALFGIAVNARYGRNSILEVFREDYITTARAKGLTERVVVRKHMLPNALMPIITNMGAILSRIIAGSVVIETVFSIPGVGLYLLSSVNNRDYPAIRSSVLFFALFTSVIMLLVDLAYAAIDPRIKAKYAGGRGV